MSFKLIAIRPLEGCSETYRKVLKEGTIYSFYNDYHFTEEDGKVVGINYLKSTPEKLFNVNLATGRTLEISVSAVIGPNGAGKSTLMELYFLCIYTLSTWERALTPNRRSLSASLRREENKERPSLPRLEQLRVQSKELELIYSGLKAELYYEIDGEITCLRFNKDEADLPRKTEDVNFEIVEIFRKRRGKFDFSMFYYSVAVNYSIFGLNSNYLGEWITRLFHKNDGYQTPLVINPMRSEGKFDINIEMTLASSRLLANLVDDNMQIKNVLKDKRVDSVLFSLDTEKIDLLGVYTMENIIHQFENREKISEFDFFRDLYKAFTGLDFGMTAIEIGRIPHFDYIRKYIIRKIFKIASTYPKYRSFYKVSDDVQVPYIIDRKKFITQLKRDQSHITLKLKQIINTVRFNLLREDNDYKWVGHSFRLPVDVLAQRLSGAHKTTDKRKTFKSIEFMPVAGFGPSIRFEGNQNFHQLSSGELQFLHSVQSIIYHVLNLNSVAEDGTSHKYQHINIMLDEIEMYFHPAFQRDLLDELFSALETLRIDSIKSLNILFATHSPFILSDFPDSHILKLQKGSPYSAEQLSPTFGANFYDLLSDAFFLDNGLTGAFARIKIQETLDYLNGKGKPNWVENENDVLALINKIGEPFLADKLRDMFFAKFPEQLTQFEKTKRIAQLEEEIKKLNS